MNRLMCVVHLIFILLIGIFGNSFLKFHFGISNIFLVIYFILSLFHVILYLRINKVVKNSNIKKFYAFLFWFVWIMFLSLLGFYKIFEINDVLFNKKYIFKQSIFILLLPIYFSMYFCFVSNEEYIYVLLKKYSGYILLLFCCLSFFNLCNSTMSYFIILAISLVFIKNSNNILYKFIIFIITILYIRNIFSKSTCYLMLFVYFIFLFGYKNLIHIIKKYKYEIIVVLLFGVIMMFINSSTVMKILENIDKNFWWRFTYWVSEIKILIKLYFLGMGFGSTYSSVNLLQVLKGGFIDSSTGMSTHDVNVLFTTAQHNSYMNVLYRTGIIGLFLFLRYTISLINNSYKLKNNEHLYIYLFLFINMNIIILFNVGLESPQFLILYYFASAGLMSMVNGNDKINN